MTDNEINNPDNLPVIPKLPIRKVPPVDGAVAICGECGLRILPTMFYSCPNANCPVFQQSTCSTL